MNKENTQKFLQDFPGLFTLYKGEPDFRFDDGWFHLVYNACSQIFELNKNLPDVDKVQISTIKEKFGSLRIYQAGWHQKLPEEISDVILRAEELSMTICEMCGKPGTLRNTRWLRVLCDEDFPKWRDRHGLSDLDLHLGHFKVTIK